MNNDTASDGGSVQLDCPALDQLQALYLAVLLPVAIIITVCLAFIIRRSRLCPGCCWQRPGLLYPIDFINNTGRRSTVAACFVGMTYTIVSGAYKNIISVNFADNERFKWLTVFIMLVNVLIVAVDFYPLFACVTHCKHIVANVVGILYSIQLFIVEVLLQTLCPLEEGNEELWRYQRLVRGAHMIFRLLTLLSYFCIVCVCIYDLGNNIYMHWKSKQLEANESSQFTAVDQDSLTYVRELMKRKRQPAEVTPVLTTQQRVKKKIMDVITYFKYRKIAGFKYSVRIVCTLATSAIAVIGLALQLTVGIDGYFLLYIDYYSEDSAFAAVVEYLTIFRVIFIVSSVLSAVIHLVFIFHMLIKYKTNLNALFRGDHSWHVHINYSPSSILLYGMQYSGYQVTYFLVGWGLTTILICVIALLFAFFIVLPLRAGASSWLTDILISVVQAAIVAVLLRIGQILLCKFVFLQDKGNSLALKNRRLYYFMSYFLFIYNTVIGVFSVLKRVLFSLVFGTLLVARLDYVLLMRGFERLDSGHMAYLSMLIVEVYHTHPVLRTFLELLNQTRANRLESDTPGVIISAKNVNGNVADDTLRRKRLRNRWYKMVTLVNNPSLVFERLMKLQQEEMQLPGISEEERFRHKQSAARLRSILSPNAVNTADEKRDGVEMV